MCVLFWFALILCAIVTAVDAQHGPYPLAPLSASSAPQPYAQLHGGEFIGSPNAASRDPLINYRWDMHAINATQLQQFALYPQSFTSPSNASLYNWDAMIQGVAAGVVLAASGPVTVRVKAPVECAGWVEMDSDDLGDSGRSLSMSISENSMLANTPAAPKIYRNGSRATYRLENTGHGGSFNPELYDGPAYVWLTFSAGTHNVTVSAIRFVCQVRPSTYAANFSSSSLDVDRVWHLGAYTVRATMLQTEYASELIQRGDREDCNYGGWNFVPEAVTLSTFDPPSWALAASAINGTKQWQHDSNIESYWLYWVEAVVLQFYVTGDKDSFAYYFSYIDARLEAAAALYAQCVEGKAILRFYGDDDRIGHQFDLPGLPEVQWAYRMSAISAHRKYAAALAAVGQRSKAATINVTTQAWVDALRQQQPPWYTQVGVHAAADALRAGFCNTTERTYLGALFRSDPNNTNSMSGFNAYYILEGMAALSDPTFPEMALGLIDQVWTTMVRLNASCTWERMDPQASSFLSPSDPPLESLNDRTSECHNWASGVTHFLNEHALGIRPVTPGFERWVVDPSLLHTEHLSAAAGSRPTPHGPLRVSHNLTAGVLEVLSVPTGSRGELVLPFRAAHVVSVWATHHGTRDCLVKVDKNRVRPSTSLAAADGMHVERTPEGAFKLGPITRPISVCWDTTALTSVKESERGVVADVPVAPRAVRLPLDRYTRGQWKGKYGSKGYVLFNYNCSGQDTRHQQSGFCDLSGSWVGIPGRPGVAITQNGANFVASAAGDWSNKHGTVYANDTLVMQNPKGSGTESGTIVDGCDRINWVDQTFWWCRAGSTKCQPMPGPGPSPPPAPPAPACGDVRGNFASEYDIVAASLVDIFNNVVDGRRYVCDGEDQARRDGGGSGGGETHNTCYRRYAAAPSSDPRLPVSPAPALRPAAIGVYPSNGVTFWVDVLAPADANYTLSLYAVDFAKTLPQMVIKVRTLLPGAIMLNCVGEDQPLSASDVAAGVYARYSVTGPVRLRIFSRHSPNGDVNGIAPTPYISAMFLD